MFLMLFSYFNSYFVVLRSNAHVRPYKYSSLYCITYNSLFYHNVICDLFLFIFFYFHPVYTFNKTNVDDMNCIAMHCLFAKQQSLYIYIYNLNIISICQPVNKSSNHIYLLFFQTASRTSKCIATPLISTAFQEFYVITKCLFECRLFDLDKQRCQSMQPYLHATSKRKHGFDVKIR